MNEMLVEAGLLLGLSRSWLIRLHVRTGEPVRPGQGGQGGADGWRPKTETTQPLEAPADMERMVQDSGAPDVEHVPLVLAEDLKHDLERLAENVAHAIEPSWQHVTAVELHRIAWETERRAVRAADDDACAAFVLRRQDDPSFEVAIGDKPLSLGTDASSDVRVAGDGIAARHVLVSRAEIEAFADVEIGGVRLRDGGQGEAPTATPPEAGVLSTPIARVEDDRSDAPAAVTAPRTCNPFALRLAFIVFVGGRREAVASSAALYARRASRGTVLSEQSVDPRRLMLDAAGGCVFLPTFRARGRRSVMPRRLITVAAHATRIERSHDATESDARRATLNDTRFARMRCDDQRKGGRLSPCAAREKGPFTLTSCWPARNFAAREVFVAAHCSFRGPRAPFVVFDCTTVSPTLVEAELFGHERGAFTGAVTSRAGVFEEANGGTLLIDEIGDLELPLQAKFLRAIDRGEVKRVGGQRSIKVQVRILSATRRDLDKAVAAGRFRDDLFHRLAVARIELPPLRERTGDVALLARRFAQEMGAPEVLTAEVLARFEDNAWPGNVRELRNAVARHIALGDDEIARSIPDGTHRSPPGPPGAARAVGPGRGTDWLSPILSMPFPIARRKTLEEFERRYVASAVAAHGGNVSAAARASGLALRYFRLVKARQSG